MATGAGCVPDSVWPTLQRHLRNSLSAEDYRTWVQPLAVGSESAERLVLEAPSQRFVQTLEEGFRPKVDWAIADLKGEGYQVLFRCAEQGAQRKGQGRGRGRGQRGAATARPGTSPRTLPDRPTAPTDSRQAAALSSKLNGLYRFGSFVVGRSNRFASAASQAVADRPGFTYNPLFLYGGVGLGKTHLLHAIGNRLRRASPDTRVMYLAAEDFVNDLISSLRQERMPQFRERYRTIDVLLVDDIQFLADKERSQEEFFHTFNVLYGRQKQIIVTSDKQPRDISNIEERLRSRFASGLMADIQPPDLETRAAILQTKARTLKNLELDTDVATFMAGKVSSNVRELEGLLNRVTAFAQMVGARLDLEFVRAALQELFPDRDRQTTARQIIKLVAQHYGLKDREIKSPGNSRQIVFPRQVAMYLCKRLTKMSYQDIGREFRGKHHSTVSYSVQRIERRRSEDEQLAAQLDRFARQLG